jgi:uncharacterized membrane protein YraQ (UPF0718 family)
MSYILNMLLDTLARVWHTFLTNWPFLLISAVIAALLKITMDPERVSAFLKHYRLAGVVAATTAAVATPLCSCGTTAVILGMMAGMMPWAPIVAFMVASPLTSPEELVYSAGLFGWPFALAFFAASIVLGIAGGAAASILESRGWLANQARLVVSCCASAIKSKASKISPQLFLAETFHTGRRLLVLFLGFAFIGYFLNSLIPASWISIIFGERRVYGILLAATLGLPFYVNTEASLPLVRAMLDAGMSQGAAMAFLITGAGTSFGAVAGALTIARWRVIGLVVAPLWVGAVLFGYAYNVMLTTGLL